MLHGPEKTGVSNQVISASERRVAWVGRVVSLVLLPFAMFFGWAIVSFSGYSGSRVSVFFGIIVFLSFIPGVIFSTYVRRFLLGENVSKRRLIVLFVASTGPLLSILLPWIPTVFLEEVPVTGYGHTGRRTLSETVQQAQSVATSSSPLVIADNQTVSESPELVGTEYRLTASSVAGVPVPLHVRVTRAVKLTRGIEGAAIGLKACSKYGCQPMYPVEVDNDEAIIALDLALTNETTRNGSGFSIYFEGHAYAVFQMSDGSYRDALNLEYVQSFDKWFEQRPTFYIEPSKTVTSTFWTRVPQDTQAVIFRYGGDSLHPLIWVPVKFAS